MSLIPRITTIEVRNWFATMDDQRIADFLDDGLEELILDLEQDDYFGTEGFDKRFA